jgi:Cytotoxic
MSYIPPPDKPPLPGLRQVKSKTPFNGNGRLRRRWKDGSGYMWEWDYQHGRLEKYDSKGKHVGEFSPIDGSQTKPADPNRSVKP